MKFGFFLLSPQIDRERSAATVLADSIALAEEAEGLGFDHLWVAEHHFANLSLSPSPLLTLSHLAARTQRIRLGTGVLVLPLQDPMRLAEEIAYVDIISGGRLDVGVGAGSQIHESRGLGVNFSRANDRFVEVLDILHMAFESGRVEFSGEHFQVPDTPMSLLPLQRPHPPIYIAGMSSEPRVMQRLAARGYRAFASLFGPANGSPAQKREAVLQGFDAAGVPREQCHYAAQRLIYVTDDPEDASDAAAHARNTLQLVHALKGGQAHFQGHFAAPPLNDALSLSLEDVQRDVMIGSPAHIAAKIREDQHHLKLEQLSCFMQFGGLDRARVMRSMRRFMEEVVPAV
jgi:alkanesulfonate monooxygenase SsuD/methylene tetrahydromethanopterin reductase-like flavin-dependent oxidoreductase (luciferase family)